MNDDVTTYCSFCKINLGLEVLRKRDDGYHDINTLFFQLNKPYDVLTVTASDSYELVVCDPTIPSDSSNLISKAIQRCSEVTGTSLPKVRIGLQKNVPHGAGLGGGSANAATAIEIFSELVVELSPQVQLEIARSLGADVPFFLQAFYNAAVASGKGDILEPVAIELNYPIVVVKPRDISIPTAEAYKALQLTGREPTDFLAAIDQPLSCWRSIITNDFEKVAFEKFPALKYLKHQLYNTGAGFALMSGSGSSLFGVYPDSKTAEKAIEEFQKDQSLQAFLANNYPG